MMLHVLQELEKHSTARAESMAVRSVGSASTSALNNQQLHELVMGLAQALDQLIPAGGTILLCGANRPSYVAGFLGILSANRVVFPISGDLAVPELAAVARASSPAGILADGKHAPQFSQLFGQSLPLKDDLFLLFDPPAAPSSRDGPALLLQSSGTTAEPKIVHRDAASLDAVTKNMVQACGFTAGDHVLAAVPLCHSYGLEHGILAPVAAGACVHLCEKFDLPLVLNEIRQGGITIFPGVPFMFEMLCRAAAERFPRLRLTYSAGGPLAPAVATAFHEHFGLRIGQVYGATEIGSVTFNDPTNDRYHPANVGNPMSGVRIVILNPDDPSVDRPLPPGTEGMIAVSAPSMFRGYLDGSSESMIGGFFLTGDLGFVEADDLLTVSGRLKLLIDIGGRKVNPLEVEAVISRHPDVGSSIVLPLRLGDNVQRLKAIVTPTRPDVEISIAELRRFTRERPASHLARWKNSPLDGRNPMKLDAAFRLLVRCLAPFLPFGCTAAPPEHLPTYQWTNSADGLQIMARRSQSMRTIDGACSMMLIRADGRSVQLDGALAMDLLEKNVRIRAWKVNEPVFDLTLIGNELWLQVTREQEGRPQVLPAGLSAAQLARALSFFGPSFFTNSRLEVVDTGGAEFELREPIDESRMLIARVQRSTLTIRQFRLLDAVARSQFELNLWQYESIGGIVWPSRLTAINDGSRIELDLRDVQLNIPLPAKVFVPPRNAQRLP
jgi:acyl-CoA synthetase (AMP-forming)/AMP-acid ligase II